MSIWLNVQCGSYSLLLDVQHVIEVAARSVDADAAGRRQWRQQTLPVLDLAQRLTRKPGLCREQVVLGENGVAQRIVDVDQVLGIREMNPEGFVALVAVTPDLQMLVDGVWPETDGRCLLRLRYPFKGEESAVVSDDRRSA